MAEPENILVVGVNWIGDSVMAMPALQSFRRRHPDVGLTVLVKPAVADLWALHAAPDAVWRLERGRAGLRATIRRIRDAGFHRAFILPNSFRSAWIPWRAGVPERHGAAGHWRRPLLTHVVPPDPPSDRRHQVFEYLRLLAADGAALDREPPRLTVPRELEQRAQELTAGCARPLVVFLPGAARGPSKQWPAGHFVALGRALRQETRCGLLVLGTPGEGALCEAIAAGIGPETLNLAGRTSLKEWIALLGVADVVVANDSGGMHVAAALDRPLVALYGLTDPAVTGPLGTRVTVLQGATGPVSRDIPRDSEAARTALAAIRPDQAIAAVRQWL
jgi:heptosyltransferase II